MIQPEYFLSHIIDLLNTYAPMITDHLQPVLHRRFQNSRLNASSMYTDSTTVFITSLLPMLRRKVFNYLPQIAMQPQLLSHFIHELIEFDTVLREEWGYSPHGGASNWKGLTWEVLVEQDWFGRWLEVEKNCMPPLVSSGHLEQVGLTSFLPQSPYLDIRTS